MKKSILLLVTLLSFLKVGAAPPLYGVRQFISMDLQDTILLNFPSGAISGVDSIEVDGVWYSDFPSSSDSVNYADTSNYSHYSDTANYSLNASIDYGTEGQMPIVNATGDGFNYGALKIGDDTLYFVDIKTIQALGKLRLTMDSDSFVISNSGNTGNKIVHQDGSNTLSMEVHGYGEEGSAKFQAIGSTQTSWIRSKPGSFDLYQMNPNGDRMSVSSNSTTTPYSIDFTYNSSGWIDKLNIYEDSVVSSVPVSLDTVYWGGTPLGLSDVTGGGGGIPYSQTRDSIQADEFDSLTADTTVTDIIIPKDSTHVTIDTLTITGSINTTQADNAILQTKAQLADSLYDQFDSTAYGIFVIKFDNDSLWIDNGTTTTKLMDAP